MLTTTTGIVLRTYPFKDKKLIVKIFTKDDGLVSCIINKSRSQIILSELLTIAEITYKKTRGESLSYIKDSHVDYVYQNLTTCRKKIQCAIVLCEILSKCLSEKSALAYDFITSAFKSLDTQKSFIIGFDSLFLIKLCKILGIQPLNSFLQTNTNVFLSIKNGCYVSRFDIKDCVPLKESNEIRRLSSMSFNELQNYKLDPCLNNNIFHYMVSYISMHLADLNNLKSIKIIKELL